MGCHDDPKMKAKKDQGAKADKPSSQAQEAPREQSATQPHKLSGDTNQTGAAQAPVKTWQMTPQQALRLLQAQKDREKFFMEKPPHQPLNRRFKEW
jgi:ABC-type glycerol-3-phosphate transport system substrate-binding protein